MIELNDYKMEIGFADDGKPYCDVFCKGEPRKPDMEENWKLSKVLGFLADKMQIAAKEMLIEEAKEEAKNKLRHMNEELANEILTEYGKKLWVEAHNETTGGRGYAIDANGNIVDVPMEGVWE